ncbi:MAG: MerR family transcriptional regulator [Clostridiales Family XIII bacterium]|nr:MerR family transcriptional regulator [Clostridiales Family XIII bacterium]
MNGTELLSMKKFSEFTGINQTTLRYYDKIGLFSPVSRGTNDYRNYSPQQIITINLINVLSDLGVPLKQINEMVHDRTPEKLLAVLTSHEKNLDAQMRHLYESYSTIHILRELIQTGCAADESAVSEVEMDAMPLIMGPENDFQDNTLFYETFINFYKRAEEMGINLNYPIGGYFETTDDFWAEPSQPTCFFSLDPHGHHEKPAGRYVVAYSRGYYGEMGDVTERLKSYSATHNIHTDGPLYVIYLHDEISVADPKEYLAQVSILVRPESTRR